MTTWGGEEETYVGFLSWIVDTTRRIFCPSSSSGAILCLGFFFSPRKYVTDYFTWHFYKISNLSSFNTNNKKKNIVGDMKTAAAGAARCRETWTMHHTDIYTYTHTSFHPERYYIQKFFFFLLLLLWQRLDFSFLVLAMSLSTFLPVYQRTRERADLLYSGIIITIIIITIITYVMLGVSLPLSCHCGRHAQWICVCVCMSRRHGK